MFVFMQFKKRVNKNEPVIITSDHNNYRKKQNNNNK